jgi:hypothetical protein
MLLSAHYSEGFCIRITVTIGTTPNIQLIPQYILMTLEILPLPCDP